MVECSFTNQVLVDSNLVVVTQTSDMAPTSSEEFLDIQANYRVWIHSESRAWHDNNRHSNQTKFAVLSRGPKLWNRLWTSRYTKENFIPNEDRISLVTEYVHLLSSTCADVFSEKRRARWKNLNLNNVLVLFNEILK